MANNEAIALQSGKMQTLIFITGVCLAIFAVALSTQIIIITPPEMLAADVAHYNNHIDALQQQGAGIGTLLDTRLTFTQFLMGKILYLWAAPVVILSITIMLVMGMNYRDRTKVLLDRLNHFRTLYKNEKHQKRTAFAELERSEDYLYKVHEQLSEGFIALSRDERIEHLNKTAIQAISEWSKGPKSLRAYKGQLLETLIPGYISSGLSVSIRDTITKRTVWRREVYIKDLNAWFDMRLFPAGESGVYIYFSDISDFKNTGSGAIKSDLLLKNMSQGAPFCYAIMDRQWNYITASNQWQEKFLAGEGAEGENHKGSLPQFPGKWHALESQLLQNKPVVCDEMQVRFDNKDEWISWQIHPWTVGGKVQGFMMFADVVTETRSVAQKSEAKREKERQLAYHDTLTGLPNRQLFYDRLTMALAQAYRQLGSVALLFLDLDGFKGINDNLGHDVGDMLLKETAERLKKTVRDTDTVARLGGDEFTVILTGLTSSDDAQMICEKIIKEINKVYHLAGHEVHVSTSIGVSLYPSDGTTSADLIKKADTAMYRSKEGGKNQYTFFSTQSAQAKDKLAPAPQGSEQLTQRELEGQIRTALKKNEIDIYFQPQFNATTGDIFGMESLIRWQHPELGTLLPRSFLNMAETTGSILPIGAWVIAQTCQKIADWREKHHGQPLQFSVNFSRRQLLDESLISRLEQAFTATRIDYTSLVIEISESMVMDNEPDILAAVKKLSKLGCKIYVDDFGVRYTPMINLQHWPIDGFKIHKTFIAKALSNTEDKALVQALIALGTTLNKDIIIEGIETQEQLDFVKTLGCDKVQGYFIAKPMNNNDVSNFFIAQEQKRDH